MTLLVIGGDGAIGAAIVTALEAAGQTVVATSRRPGAAWPLDLAADPSRWALPCCDGAVIAAGIGQLAACEADPATTARVNVGATAALVRRLPFVLHLSTTQVLAGDTAFAPTDAPIRPRNEYGRQKAAAEAMVLAAGGAVLRLSKVLAPEPAQLVRFAETLRAGGTVSAFADMVIAPVTVAQAAEAAARLLIARRGGIFHLSGDADLSYAAIARWMAGRIGHGSVAEESHVGKVPDSFVQAHTTLAPSFGPAPSSWAVIEAVLAHTLSLPPG